MMESFDLEAQEVAQEAGAGPSENGNRVNILSVLPGGESPGSEVLAVGGIVLGALFFLIVGRRFFRGAVGAGHVHIGSADVLFGFAGFLIASAMWKTVQSQPQVANSPLGRAMSWLHS